MLKSPLHTFQQALFVWGWDAYMTLWLETRKEIILVKTICAIYFDKTVLLLLLAMASLIKEGRVTSVCF